MFVYLLVNRSERTKLAHHHSNNELLDTMELQERVQNNASQGYIVDNNLLQNLRWNVVK